ncbi:hypothetical protein TNIN_427031 [Trichonephila inaurata madagascariensis]|uniref:Uncharacterized protein n=1 Tax=Trichonephila inaurata madagascariensis TaxID=2747483 RepID=A0A8X7C2G9_9ARAC|nr:hypothetical protein TNIN_427031 [Trichonephila inaurata madagascariensis]
MGLRLDEHRTKRKYNFFFDFSTPIYIFLFQIFFFWRQKKVGHAVEEPQTYPTEVDLVSVIRTYVFAKRQPGTQAQKKKEKILRKCRRKSYRHRLSDVPKT